MTKQWSHGDFSLANGTSFQGSMNITYLELVAKLGLPSFESIDGKTQAQWVICFTLDDGHTLVATVYDWKEHRAVDQVTCWHIGGHFPAAEVHVLELFNEE